MQRNPLPEYLTPAEVADVRRVSVDSLTQERWRMVKRGADGPPFIKAGRRVLYPRDACPAWLNERMRTAQAS